MFTLFEAEVYQWAGRILVHSVIFSFHLRFKLREVSGKELSNGGRVRHTGLD